MEQTPMVSVYTLAFNHERYIRDTIEGVLMQQCPFTVEHLIHDDASTDGTAQIIREYAQQYPDRIFPILQTQNQWSQGILIFPTHILPRIRGKYIAVCEGDDYWTDPEKLRKQVEYMEAHPDCTMCITNGQIVDQSGKMPPRNFVPINESDARYYTGKNRVLTLDELYQISFVPTASFLMRRDSFDRLPSSYARPCPNGDMKLRLYHTALGYSYYMDDVTCVYRQNVPNSAMTNWQKGNRSAAYIRNQKTIAMMRDVDEFTGGCHQDGIGKISRDFIISLLHNAASLPVLFRDLKEPDCRKVYRQLSLSQRLTILIKAAIPESILRRLRS